jgi:hypothetical protein
MVETGFGFPKSKNFGTAMGLEVVTADEVLPRLFTGEVGGWGGVVLGCITRQAPRTACGQLADHSTSVEASHSRWSICGRDCGARCA